MPENSAIATSVASGDQHDTFACIPSPMPQSHDAQKMLEYGQMRFAITRRQQRNEQRSNQQGNQPYDERRGMAITQFTPNTEKRR